jgi:predicted nucleic acid-binding protein
MKLVLDTNIYRNLVRGKSQEEIDELILKILNKCKEKNIEICFPIVPAMELISHYNDENENEKSECRSALKLLVSLSTTITEHNLHIDFIPPLNVILGHYFFGKEDNFLKMYAQVITVAQKLTGNEMITEDDNIDDAIETIIKQLEFEKEEIRNNYENYLKSINEGNADWEHFQQKDKKADRADFFKRLKDGRFSFLVAQSFISRAYFITETTFVKDENYYNLVIRFMQDFCPVLIMNELLLNNIGQGVAAIQDIRDKRWNTVLDISLMFGVIYNPKDENKKLVTCDKNILKSFDVCGFNEKVMTLDKFIEILDLDKN